MHRWVTVIESRTKCGSLSAFKRHARSVGERQPCVCRGWPGGRIYGQRTPEATRHNMRRRNLCNTSTQWERRRPRRAELGINIRRDDGRPGRAEPGRKESRVSPPRAVTRRRRGGSVAIHGDVWSTGRPLTADDNNWRLWCPNTGALWWLWCSMPEILYVRVIRSQRAGLVACVLTAVLTVWYRQTCNDSATIRLSHSILTYHIRLLSPSWYRKYSNWEQQSAVQKIQNIVIIFSSVLRRLIVDIFLTKCSWQHSTWLTDGLIHTDMWDACIHRYWFDPFAIWYPLFGQRFWSVAHPVQITMIFHVFV